MLFNSSCLYLLTLPSGVGHNSFLTAFIVFYNHVSYPVSLVAPPFPLVSCYRQDAADSYSVAGGDVSQWWVDLANELKHYIEYGVWLEKETMRWRNTQIDCFIDKADGACLAFEWMGLTCYDKYVVSMMWFLSTERKTDEGRK